MEGTGGKGQELSAAEARTGSSAPRLIPSNKHPRIQESVWVVDPCERTIDSRGVHHRD
jgi:hypothetical protein